MVPVGTVEQSLLYLPEYHHSVNHADLTRTVKTISNRVLNIEQYLKAASDRDRPHHIGLKFKEMRRTSSEESDGSQGMPLCELILTFLQANDSSNRLVTALQPLL